MKARFQPIFIIASLFVIGCSAPSAFADDLMALKNDLAAGIRRSRLGTSINEDDLKYRILNIQPQLDADHYFSLVSDWMTLKLLSSASPSVSSVESWNSEFAIPIGSSHSSPSSIWGVDTARQRLELKPEYLEGLEWAAMARRPNEANLFRLIRALALAQLKQGLRVARNLKSNAQIVNESNEIPPEFQGVLNSSLVKTHEELRQNFPSLIDEALTERIALTLNVKKETLSPSLLDYSRKIFQQAFKIEIQNTRFSSPFTLSAGRLTRILSAAHANSILVTLAYLAQNGSIQVNSPRMGQDLMTILDEARGRYESLLAVDSVLEWKNLALHDAAVHALRRPREWFIGNLLIAATRLSTLHIDREPLDVEALSSTFTDEWTDESNNESIGDPIVTDYSREIILTFTHDQNGVALDWHEVSKKYREWQKLKAQPNTLRPTGALEQQIVAHVEKSRSQVNDLIECWGKQMGLNRPEAGDLSDLLNKKQRKTYLKKITARIEATQRLLGKKILFPYYQTAQIMTLGDALARLNHLNPGQSSLEIYSLAIPLVDQALDKIERELLKEIERVEDSRALSDIESFVQSPKITDELHAIVPEILPAHGKYLESEADLSTTERLADHLLGKTVRPYLRAVEVAGAALLIFEGMKWFSRKDTLKLLRFNSLEESLSPLLKGFFKPLVPSLLIDSAEQSLSLRPLIRKSRGADALDWIGDQSAHDSQLDYEHHLASLGIRLTLDYFLVYRNLLRLSLPKGVSR